MEEKKDDRIRQITGVLACLGLIVSLINLFNVVRKL